MSIKQIINFKNIINEIKKNGNEAIFSKKNYPSGDFRVAIYSENQKVITWSKKYFENYFSNEIVSPEYKIYCSNDLGVYNHCISLSQDYKNKEIDFLYFNEFYYISYLFNDYNGSISFYLVNTLDKEILIVSNVDNNDYYIAPMRAIRAIYLLKIAEIGFFLHAGSFNYNNYGSIIIGERFSGKTTCILNSLSYKECGFISNDKIFIYRSENSYKILGLPISIGIRIGAITNVERIHDVLMSDIFNFDSDITLEDISKTSGTLCRSDKKITMSPNELCNAFQCRWDQDCYVKVFFYPVYDKHAETAVCFEVTDHDKKHKYLQEQYIDYITPEQVIFEPVLNIDKSKMSHNFNCFCNDSFDSYPFYTIYNNKNTMSESYKIIKSMLTE